MENGLYYGKVKLSKIADLGPLLGVMGSRPFDCLFVDENGGKTKIQVRLDDFGKWFNTRIEFGQINSFVKKNEIPMVFYCILPELTMLEDYDEPTAMNLLVYQLRFVRTVSQDIPVINKLGIQMNGKIYNLTNVTETALLIADLAEYYFTEHKFPDVDMKLLSNVLCNLKGFNLELDGLEFPSFILAPSKMHLDHQGIPII
jgi:hypothetical protein